MVNTQKAISSTTAMVRLLKNVWSKLLVVIKWLQTKKRKSQIDDADELTQNHQESQIKFGLKENKHRLLWKEEF